MRPALLALALLLTALLAAPAGAAPSYANRCVTVDGGHQPLYLKPTGLRTFLLSDRAGRLLGPDGKHAGTPSKAVEWRRSKRVRLRPARGCRAFPEAALSATGVPFRGSLRGIADAHLHVTANLRAGGQVISGEPFDRFGITEALGHDADVHGPQGAADVTGNLLRDGTSTGTHDTDGWPAFDGWPTFDTITHQQVYWRWLQRAWLGGLRLAVAQTVEDQPLCDIEPKTSHSCDETATIRLEVRQLRALQDYVDAQAGGRGKGFFRIVTSPAQARKVIRRGRLAVVIGAESSGLFGCDQRLGVPACDRAQIDRGIAALHGLGVRSVFLAHWVDNALAGAALEPGAKGAFIGLMEQSHTGAPFTTGPCPSPEQGESCNTRGLTELGAYAVERLMDRGMLVEVDHLSEVARDQVLAIAERRHLPVVSSHTGTGGEWTADELRRLYALGGFASVTLDDPETLPSRIERLGPTVGLGTDTGGFKTLPGPPARRLAYPFRSHDRRIRFARQRTGTRTFDLTRDGMAHYGLLPDQLASVEREPGGRKAVTKLFGSARAYVRTWERAQAGR